MSNSEKILKTISSLIENGILTSKDIQKEISTDFKFKKERLINKLELVSREEFEVLKKIVQKQDLIIKGQRIKPYRFNLTGKNAKKAAMFRKVKKALEKKKRERLSAIPGPGYPPPPQIAPHLFGIIQKDRTRKKKK